ncbi:MAG: hypothetical protein ACRCZD_02065 [Phycicoccus sp.]
MVTTAQVPEKLAHEAGTARSRVVVRSYGDASSYGLVACDETTVAPLSGMAIAGGGLVAAEAPAAGPVPAALVAVTEKLAVPQSPDVGHGRVRLADPPPPDQRSEPEGLDAVTV